MSLWNSFPAARWRPEMTLLTFEATTQGLSVPHLMCRRTEGTSTTTRHCCGIFRDSGSRHKTPDLRFRY